MNARSDSDRIEGDGGYEGQDLLRRWDDVDPLFRAALPLTGAERAALLERRCAGDPELRALVRELLSLAATADPFLAHPPALGPFDRSTDLLPVAMHGTRLGAFELEEVLGWGGLGVVYRARRVAGGFQQQVAVKLLLQPPGRDLSASLEREREILASLDHPAIARILDGGTAPDGRPYLVMELVEGLPVTAHCDEVSAGVRQRLRLFLRICEAVAGAHGRSVVHRDLKPSNILVTRDGDPKLLDFGIARLLKPPPGEAAGRGVGTAGLTHTGMRAFSPAYASPEQVTGEPVSVASDIFQLGTLLYELLTGTHPHQGSGYTPGALMTAICDVEPAPASEAVRPEGLGQEPRSRVRALVRGDLDTIIQKALRKEPARRYASVEEFADDIRRHLDGLPVLARPASTGYRLQRFVRRHGVAAGLALFALLAAGAWLGAEATRASQSAADRSRSNYEAERNQARFAAARVQAIPAVTTGSAAMAMNDHGVIVGFARNSFGAERAVRWTTTSAGGVAGPEDLGFTTETRRGSMGSLPYSMAMGINNDGLIVGYDAMGERTRAYAYSDGLARALALPAQTVRSWALEVNDRGWAVGEATVRDGATDIRRAMVWLDPLNDDVQPIELPPLPGHQWSAGRWINDAGLVAGWSDGVNVRWRIERSGRVSGPEAIAGAAFHARGMNQSAVLVGGSGNGWGIALLRDSSTVGLPPLGHDEGSLIGGVNDAPPGGPLVIVGSSLAADTLSDRAVAWSVDANDSVHGPYELQSPHGYAMAHAADVNALGWIAGQAHNDYVDRLAVLWRPREEAGAYEVVPLGTFGPGPTASLAHFCEAGTCSFADTSVPGNAALTLRSWTSGAGETSTDHEAIFSYRSPGSYTPTLVVGDRSGRSDSARVEITCSRRWWRSLRCR